MRRLASGCGRSRRRPFLLGACAAGKAEQGPKGQQGLQGQENARVRALSVSLLSLMSLPSLMSLLQIFWRAGSEASPHRQAKDTEQHSSRRASRPALLTEPDNAPCACLSLDAYTSNKSPADLQALSFQWLPEVDSLLSEGRMRSSPPECIPFACRVLTRFGNCRKIFNMSGISRLPRQRQLFLARLSLSVCSLDAIKIIGYS
jgi:hypothetical protein